MSIIKAKEYLKSVGYEDRVIEFAESTATVAEAAEAVGVEPAMIAKTMSFLVGDKAILILAEGTARVDNRKYKDTFHVKAKMIPFDEVEQYIGHAPGGVCPFGINEGVDVYLDESLIQSIRQREMITVQCVWQFQNWRRSREQKAGSMYVRSRRNRNKIILASRYI